MLGAPPPPAADALLSALLSLRSVLEGELARSPPDDAGRFVTASSLRAGVFPGGATPAEAGRIPIFGGAALGDRGLGGLTDDQTKADALRGAEREGVAGPDDGNMPSACRRPRTTR